MHILTIIHFVLWFKIKFHLYVLTVQIVPALITRSFAWLSSAFYQQVSIFIKIFHTFWPIYLKIILYFPCLSPGINQFLKKSMVPFIGEWCLKPKSGSKICSLLGVIASMCFQWTQPGNVCMYTKHKHTSILLYLPAFLSIYLPIHLFMRNIITNQITAFMFSAFCNQVSSQDTGFQS